MSSLLNLSKINSINFVFMKKIIFALSVMFISFTTSAQNITVNGTVQSANDGLPISGVNIAVKDANKGAVSDFDGNFSISNVPSGAVLVFTYLGFETIEVAAAEDLSVTMNEDNEALDEVVVIGYGSQNRKDVTGAVSVVSAETIEKLKPIDAAQALQGTTAGVSVSSASGSPGSGFNILIRGVSSNGNNQPLLIVDGYEGNLNSLNPDDIETLTVLKDAQAAIYGVKGANGVILVTTKKGKKGAAPTVFYNAYTGTQETSKKLDYLNGSEYAALVNESFAANGQSLPYPNIAGLNNTDWQEEIFDTAMITNHNVGVSGGTENVTYYLGASNLKQDGIIASDKSNFERNNGKLSLGVDVNDKLKVSTNLNYYAVERRTINENGLGSVLFNALNISPLFATDQEDLNGLLGNEIINPLSQARDTYNTYFGNSIEGNFQIDYQLLEGLKATTRIGFKTYSDSGKNFSPIVFYGDGKVFNRDRSEVNQNKVKNNTYTWEAFLVYNKQIADHNFTATLGHSAQRFWGDGLFATGFDVPNNSWEFADISMTTGTSDALTNSSYIYDNRLTSLFGRIQYDFQGKYLLSAMIRRDGSSDFTAENRFDQFKSVTAGWKLSEEAFLQDSNVIDFLKLRGSYGTLGNNVGGNLFRAALSGEGAYVFDGALTIGTALGALPNTNATWETAEKIDIGIDAKLFNNKLEIVADYFVEDREDLLIGGLPVSGILGTSAPGSGSPTVNAGTTRSEGVELLLSYNDNISDDLSFGISYNVTKVEGEVTNINGDVPLEGGGFSVGQPAPSRMEVGLPIGYFYGLQTNGIFQSQAEIDAHPAQNFTGNAPTSPGDIRYVDTNGDGEVNIDDRTFIGKPLADYYMGLNLTLNYKNFDFTSYMFAEIGKDMVRNYERANPNVNRLDMYLDRWTGPGTSNTVPRATVGPNNNGLFSDFYVEDASFLRVQNIQLGYSLPSEVVDQLGMSKFRVYATVNNAFTFTDYEGFDPAATTGQAIGGGIDYGFYPVSRQYLLGLNISF